MVEAAISSKWSAQQLLTEVKLLLRLANPEPTIESEQAALKAAEEKFELASAESLRLAEKLADAEDKLAARELQLDTECTMNTSLHARIAELESPVVERIYKGAVRERMYKVARSKVKADLWRMRFRDHPSRPWEWCQELPDFSNQREAQDALDKYAVNYGLEEVPNG